jgi:DNA polymerase III epsilon subunit-like protein
MAKKQPFRHVWMDTETSDWMNNGGVVIEIAAIVTDGDHHILDRMEILLKMPEGASWSDGAEAVHGISREKLEADGMDRLAGLQKFKDFLKEYGIGYNGDDAEGKSIYNRAMPCGQNIKFDLEFIEAFFGELGDASFGNHFGYHTIDTMHTGKFINDTFMKMNGYLGAIFKLNGKPSVSLEAQRMVFGLQLDGAHRALKDVEDTIEVYKKTQEVLIKRIERSYQHDKLLSQARDVIDDPAALQALVKGFIVPK